MKLFIDADSIMFKAACTQDTKHDTRVVTRKIIEDSIADCFADEVYIAIKGKDNFRYNIYSDYKSSRKDKLEDKLKERLNDAHTSPLSSPTPSVRSDSSTVQALRNDLSVGMSAASTILYFLPWGTSLAAISSIVLSQLDEGIRTVIVPNSLL